VSETADTPAAQNKRPAEGGITVAEKITNEDHPIERIMSTAITRIRTLAEADTIVGSPMSLPDGTTVVPISKVAMGFVTGGGEYGAGVDTKRIDAFPFAGGSGAGISITPIGFLAQTDRGFKVITLNGETAYSKILDMIPTVLASLTRAEDKCRDKKRDKKDK
jgi:sporulation protein YtfJ